MNEEKKKISIGGFDLITVQLANIGARMRLIRGIMGGELAGDELEYVIGEAVRDIAADAIADVQQIFKTMDEYTNIRECVEKSEMEYAFPGDQGGA